MAGMPKSVVYRAKKILEQLEGKSKEMNKGVNLNKPVEKIATSREGYQLSFFQLDDPVLSQIKKELQGIDIDSLTPLEALNKLNEIKKLSGVKIIARPQTFTFLLQLFSNLLIPKTFK